MWPNSKTKKVTKLKKTENVEKLKTKKNIQLKHPKCDKTLNVTNSETINLTKL